MKNLVKKSILMSQMTARVYVKADEKKVIVEYLDSRKDDSPAAIKQVVWALLTGPELRFNH
mgnify:CR=1 FL=1